MTVVIDADLKPCVKKLNQISPEKVCRSIMEGLDTGRRPEIVYCCLKDSLSHPGNDLLFQMFITAYSQHRPILLSPDVIWLQICQNFARYLSFHSSVYQPSIVGESGKKTLGVRTLIDIRNLDLFSEMEILEFHRLIIRL